MKREDYLKTEEGIRNAERFIKALKEHRLIASVKKVSRDGLSRQIFFGEVGIVANGRPAIYQFNYFFSQLGWRYARNNSDALSISGCGMDMVFHTFESVASTLKYYGFDVPDDYLSLADDYMMI
jgi:hypothetical protein